MQTLLSPRSVTWTLCGMLRRLALPDESESVEIIQQNSLSSVFIAMSTIEAFTNIFFRIVADETESPTVKSEILNGLESHGRPYTEEKLRRWPQLAFGHAVNTDDERWKAFDAFRQKRNRLTHFKASHTTLVTAGITIAGLVDPADLLALDAGTPLEALRCVYGIVELVGEACGISANQIPSFLHSWLGLG